MLIFLLGLMVDNAIILNGLAWGNLLCLCSWFKLNWNMNKIPLESLRLLKRKFGIFIGKEKEESLKKEGGGYMKHVFCLFSLTFYIHLLSFHLTKKKEKKSSSLLSGRLIFSYPQINSSGFTCVENQYYIVTEIHLPEPQGGAVLSTKVFMGTYR